MHGRKCSNRYTCEWQKLYKYSEFSLMNCLCCETSENQSVGRIVVRNDICHGMYQYIASAFGFIVLKYSRHPYTHTHTHIHIINSFNRYCCSCSHGVVSYIQSFVHSSVTYFQIRISQHKRRRWQPLTEHRQVVFDFFFVRAYLNHSALQ